MTVAIAQGSARINSKVNGVRIGIQSYSFRGLSLDEAIKAMAGIGIGECELFSGHVEPRIGPPPGARPPQGPTGAGSGELTPEMREAMREAARKRQEETRKWRLSVALEHFTDLRKKFDAAGLKL